MSDFLITSVTGRHKKRKRKGRGTSSGHGKTCCRGNNGSLSRAGAMRWSLHEGGQTTVCRRMPKRGFSNFNFCEKYEVVNVEQLERFEDGSSIGLEQLSQAGLIDDCNSTVKILGTGELTKRLDVMAHKFSKAAEQKIAGCGGTAKVI